MNEEFVDSVAKKALVRYSESVLTAFGELLVQAEAYEGEESMGDFLACKLRWVIARYQMAQELLRDDKTRQKHLKSILEGLK